jgi:hypothetical protein
MPLPIEDGHHTANRLFDDNAVLAVRKYDATDNRAAVVLHPNPPPIVGEGTGTTRRLVVVAALALKLPGLALRCNRVGVPFLGRSLLLGGFLS